MKENQPVDPLEQKLIEDIEWEQAHPELKGWKRVKAFIDHVFDDREKAEEAENEQG